MRRQLSGAAVLHGLQQVSYFHLILWKDAFNQGTATAGSVRKKNLSVQARRGPRDVWKATKTLQQGSPIADAVSGHTHQGNVRGRSKQTILKIPSHAIRDG